MTKAERQSERVRQSYADRDAEGVCVYCGDRRMDSPITGRQIKTCYICEQKRRVRRKAQWAKQRAASETKAVGYHHAAVKGTGRYDSQYQPSDLPAHVIDAIFLREQRKKRPAWSLCR